MTYFIATKQFVEYEAESQRLKSKTEKPRMGKEPSIFYFLETKINALGKRNTLNSGERACNKLQWVS